MITINSPNPGATKRWLVRSDGAPLKSAVAYEAVVARNVSFRAEGDIDDPIMVIEAESAQGYSAQDLPTLGPGVGFRAARLVMYQDHVAEKGDSSDGEVESCQTLILKPEGSMIAFVPAR